jgi:HSP20 family protein
MTTQQKQENGGNDYVTSGSGSQRGEGMHGRSASPQMMRRDSFEAAFEGPFALMNRLFQDMDQMFHGLLPSTPARQPVRSQEWRPAVDVFERDGKLIVQADVPGMQKENLSVEVRDNRLFISGERRGESDQQQGGYRQTERSYGKFTRAVALPPWVRPEDMAAKFEDGVLQVEIPMLRRQIEIQ